MCIKFGLIAVGAVVYLNKICYQSNLTQVLRHFCLGPMNTKYFMRDWGKANDMDIVLFLKKSLRLKKARNLLLRIRWGNKHNPNWKLTSAKWLVKIP